MKLGAAKALADSMLSKAEQERLMDDFEDWCVEKKGWPADKKGKIPMKYLHRYIKEVKPFTRGVGSWRKKNKDV